MAWCMCMCSPPRTLLLFGQRLLVCAIKRKKLNASKNTKQMMKKKKQQFFYSSLGETQTDRQRIRRRKFFLGDSIGRNLHFNFNFFFFFIVVVVYELLSLTTQILKNLNHSFNCSLRVHIKFQLFDCETHSIYNLQKEKHTQQKKKKKINKQFICRE